MLGISLVRCFTLLDSSKCDCCEDQRKNNDYTETRSNHRISAKAGCEVRSCDDVVAAQNKYRQVVHINIRRKVRN
ncbi:hypothetical protein KIN20_028315 [Parelaphostrongylus tenuis]|uniref:Secreted protein n=1 Tax=Parelaphostrongylus tenuis TaxID=148309 RepID=A0AAD5R0L9_PARTN|nr:hypothetical protein KIN20_028315 [Parelaphostrongylus tenuis]